MLHILRCSKCGSYGLGESCGCGGTRVKPKPPKYSPEDKYGGYRRQFKSGKAADETEGSAGESAADEPAGEPADGSADESKE